MLTYTKTNRVLRAATLWIMPLTFLVVLPASAAPPHPGLLEQTATAKKAVPYFMANQSKLREAGINSGTISYTELPAAAKLSINPSPDVTGEFKVAALLVRFPDKAGATTASYFDDLMFDASGISVRNYYREASFEQLDITTMNTPSSLGWVQAPQTYTYYVNNESGVNPDSYPHNAQKLVEDLVARVDPMVDFSQYDNNDDGFVDVLMVIHAGPGAEKTGSNTDMWSHQWSIYPYLTNDGVYVSSYTMQPEYLDAPGDMTIGVFAHELGHAFGLPDLYDTDYSSNGIGSWGIMAYGSWLGPQGNGGIPASPCAWSRAQMGFADPTNVASNTNDQAIADVKASGDIYRLWTTGSTSEEYFLVENRQRSGYDAYLPASGLLIWHIDEAMESNDNEWFPGLNPANHYLVALEQCDGLYEMELCFDEGDGNDVFPGSGGANSFNALSAVSSESYTDGSSMVAVNNISDLSFTMTADLLVGLSGGTNDGSNDDGGTIDEHILPSTLTLSQNYPNPFNPTTTISFYSPNPGPATVEVINPLGYTVKTLLDANVAAGYTELVWDGTNRSGDVVASGIYLYKVEINSQKQVKKMVLVR